MRLSQKLFFFGLLLLAFFFPSIGRADTVFNLTATPAVIDVPACEKGQICLEKTVFIKNNSSVRADVYAQVNDLSPAMGIIPYSDPSELPADASLVRWIEFYRAVIEIQPGQTATQTLRIIASPNATPGKYHALISFPTGGNLTEAQATDQKLNEAKVQINLDIVEHQVEQAEINRFQPVSGFFTNNNISFILKIKNIGNQPVSPEGEIVIYDKGGKEVGSIPISGSTIAPNEIKDFPAQTKLNIGPGKFKARLNLNYGQDNGKNLTDIVYFSYLPLALFLVLLVFILGLATSAAVYISKRKKEKRSSSAAAAHDEEDSSSGPTVSRAKHHHKYIINLKR